MITGHRSHARLAFAEQPRQQIQGGAGGGDAALFPAKLPGHSGSWDDVIAAYTRVDAHEVTLASITAPHRAETLRKTQEARGPVLFIRDDTNLDLTSHEAMEGRRAVGTKTRWACSARFPQAPR